MYVTGYTKSPDFPAAGALQPRFGGAMDAFLTKLDPSGFALVYSSYLGGKGMDEGMRVAVAASAEAIVAGTTTSADFPVMNDAQANFGGGFSDAFVARFSEAGSALLYSTFLGGNQLDGGTGLAVDSSGHVYLLGITQSTNFPTLNAIQPTQGGGSIDAFLVKLDVSGSELAYSTYLGGSGSSCRRASLWIQPETPTSPAPLLQRISRSPTHCSRHTGAVSWMPSSRS